VANLILRVGLALAIVGVAVGMTAAASETVTPCAPPSCATAATDAYARPGGPADLAVTAGNASAPASATTVDATMLVLLVTALVVFAIFVILFSYRLRPGGVRAQDR
jgi:disulfide bond formation protein DsbB